MLSLKQRMFSSLGPNKAFVHRRSLKLETCSSSSQQQTTVKKYCKLRLWHLITPKCPASETIRRTYHKPFRCNLEPACIPLQGCNSLTNHRCACTDDSLKKDMVIFIRPVTVSRGKLHYSLLSRDYLSDKTM